MNDSKFQTIGASVEHLEEIKKQIAENREKDQIDIGASFKLQQF